MRLGADPREVTVSGPYATVDDLEVLIGVGMAPANAGLLLTRASRAVDQVLLCAVYARDDNNNPTEAAVITALRDATCETVCAWQAAGLSDGYATGYTSVSIGSVSLSGGSNAKSGAGSATDIGPQAWAILQAAGLTGFEPYNY